MIEAKMQYYSFVGFMMGLAFSKMEYGVNVTKGRYFRCGIKWAFLFGAFQLPYTFFICPVCQWPNRNQLQVQSWEQRFKDYMDKSYGLYDNANRDFYDTLTSQERLRELRAELRTIEKRKVKIIQDAVTEYTTTGKNFGKNDDNENNL